MRSGRRVNKKAPEGMNLRVLFFRRRLLLNIGGELFEGKLKGTGKANGIAKGEIAEVGFTFFNFLNLPNVKPCLFGKACLGERKLVPAKGNGI